MKKYVKHRVTELPADFLGESTRYENERGIISLLPPCYATLNYFEIYSLKGNLFVDVERFDTLSDAEERIKELLGETFKFGR